MAQLAHAASNHGKGLTTTLGDLVSQAPKPAQLIGYSGLLVTEDENGRGCRLCFAWCCELPGNSYNERKLRAAFSR